MTVNQHSSRPYNLDALSLMVSHFGTRVIEPTSKTPFVCYDEFNQVLMVKGNSTKPDMQKFYHEILTDVKANLEETDQLTVSFYFQNINTSTAKVLFDFFKYLRSMRALGKRIHVIWSAEADNEMMETGRDFAEIYDMDFHYLAA
ncbi:SiaC family regulatory phosphoprotein [Marinoscillum luteum]|uniref:SiaC family regulatory phosphoprotein n=1 Tax=Marinoscillum luteum TaxID=861051 RepID=A0ABW7NBU5_9BACT